MQEVTDSKIWHSYARQQRQRSNSHKIIFRTETESVPKKLPQGTTLQTQLCGAMRIWKSLRAWRVINAGGKFHFPCWQWFQVGTPKQWPKECWKQAQKTFWDSVFTSLPLQDLIKKHSGWITRCSMRNTSIRKQVRHIITRESRLAGWQCMRRKDFRYTRRGERHSISAGYWSWRKEIVQCSGNKLSCERNVLYSHRSCICAT